MIRGVECKFMGLPLEGPMTEFAEKLVAMGYTIDPGENSKWFIDLTGDLEGHPCKITLSKSQFSSDIEKAEVHIPMPSIGEAHELFNELFRQLRAAYGTYNDVSDEDPDEYSPEELEEALTKDAEPFFFKFDFSEPDGFVKDSITIWLTMTDEIDEEEKPEVLLEYETFVSDADPDEFDLDDDTDSEVIDVDFEPIQ